MSDCEVLYEIAALCITGKVLNYSLHYANCNSFTSTEKIYFKPKLSLLSLTLIKFISFIQNFLQKNFSKTFLFFFQNRSSFALDWFSNNSLLLSENRDRQKDKDVTILDSTG